MVYKLNIGERFVLAQLLPSEGNFLLMKRRRELLEALMEFTDEEQKQYGFVQNPDGRLNWNPEFAEMLFEIEIGELMADNITKKIKQLDEQNQLHDDQVTLYEKFVGT